MFIVTLFISMKLPLAKIEFGPFLNRFGYKDLFSGLNMRLTDLFTSVPQKWTKLFMQPCYVLYGAEREQLDSRSAYHSH